MPRDMTKSEQRLEDLLWMAETGEHAEGAAKRLGMEFKSLDRWAHKHMPETWALMLKRRPRDHNGRTAGANQWRAA